LLEVSDKNIKIIMGETSTEFPDSLIPAATVKAERISRAVRRLSAAVQIELIDTDLSQAHLDDAKREELAKLGNELLGFMNLGHSLLKSIVKAGSLGAEENGGGLPLRITAGTEILELEAPSPNGDSEIGGLALEELSSGAAAAVKAETEVDLSNVEVIIGLATFDKESLGLTSKHEIALLKALPDLKGHPLTRKWILDRGFYADATGMTTRQQAYNKAALGLCAKLEEATGLRILEKVGEKGKRRYLVTQEFMVDGSEVSVSDDVKKN
jgi:hypothetical protein